MSLFGRAWNRLRGGLLRRIRHVQWVARGVEKARRLELLVRRGVRGESVRLTIDQYRQAKYFGLTKATTEILFEQLGHTDVRIVDTPHYALACALNKGVPKEIEDATARYTRYFAVKSSSAEVTTRDPSPSEFVDLYENMSGKRGCMAKAVASRTPNSGDCLVFSGVASLASGLVLDRDARIRILPFDLAFKTYSSVPEFYGTKHNNRPYQSIYIGRDIALPGRREDALERLSLIPADLITGKSVLDVASNFGMSSILARRLGAESVLGLERSSSMVDLATRFAALEGFYPRVQFRPFDIDSDALEPGRRFDVCFMFSIYAHLRDPAKLRRIVESHVEHSVIFESHPGGCYEDYKEFFNCGLFRSIVPLGKLSRSVFIPERNRTLWVCSRE